jgi:hypothetical protein
MGGISQLTFQLLDDNFQEINLGSNIGITLSLLFEFE